MANNGFGGHPSVHSKWSSGNLQWTDSSGNVIATLDGANRKLTLPSGSHLDVSALKLGTGFIDLGLDRARAIATNDIGAIAVGGAGTVGSGGILGSDGSTAPALKRRNAATDPSVDILWAANVVTEIQWIFTIPPDMDVTAASTFNYLASMGGAMDVPVLTAKCFTGVGGTDLGGATAALAATEATVTVTIAASSFTVGQQAIMTLVPGTHANDAVRLRAAYFTYTRLGS